MRRETAVRLLGRLHGAQNELYGGGSDAGLERVLTSDADVPGPFPAKVRSPAPIGASKRCSTTFGCDEIWQAERSG